MSHNVLSAIPLSQWYYLIFIDNNNIKFKTNTLLVFILCGPNVRYCPSTIPKVSRWFPPVNGSAKMWVCVCYSVFGSLNVKNIAVVLAPFTLNFHFSSFSRAFLCQTWCSSFTTTMQYLLFQQTVFHEPAEHFRLVLPPSSWARHSARNNCIKKINYWCKLWRAFYWS